MQKNITDIIKQTLIYAFESYTFIKMKSDLKINRKKDLAYIIFICYSYVILSRWKIQMFNEVLSDKEKVAGSGDVNFPWKMDVGPFVWHAAASLCPMP